MNFVSGLYVLFIEHYSLVLTIVFKLMFFWSLLALKLLTSINPFTLSKLEKCVLLSR